MASALHDDDDWECPLCMEEMDLSDRNFKPCPCGYQICRFCWNHIKENLNNRCPACRREYNDQTVEFTPLTPAELQKVRNEKRQKEREKKEMEANNRRHLANMRVVQKNLVYVIGLTVRIANEETLRQHDFFGQYGKIVKIVVNRKNMGGGYHGAEAMEQSSSSKLNGRHHDSSTVGVYVTFARKEDAARCIQSVDGTVYEGRILRASYGTTKYCTYFLRGLLCQNPGCMYLHEPGDDSDSYTKEEMALGKHHAKIHPAGTPSHPSSENHGSSAGPVVAPFGISSNLADETASASSKKPDPPHPSGSDELFVHGSPSSLLPRTAAWAAKQASNGQGLSKPHPGSADSVPDLGITANPSVGDDLDRKDQDGIRCQVFDIIDPKICPTYRETRSRMNTAPFHRYLRWAVLAREYFIQITSQPAREQLGSDRHWDLYGANIDVFGFDPFRDEEVDQEPDGRALGNKSRFTFAQASQGGVAGRNTVTEAFPAIEQLSIRNSPQLSYPADVPLQQPSLAARDSWKSDNDPIYRPGNMEGGGQSFAQGWPTAGNKTNNSSNFGRLNGTSTSQGYMMAATADMVPNAGVKYPFDGADMRNVTYMNQYNGPAPPPSDPYASRFGYIDHSGDPSETMVRPQQLRYGNDSGLNFDGAHSRPQQTGVSSLVRPPPNW